MKKRQTPFVVANWKMHPKTLLEAKKLFSGIRNRTARIKNVRTILCPPTLYLGALLDGYKGSAIAFGAQDVFWENAGSHTGMISPKMLGRMGASAVILGHSERRSVGESSSEIAKKVSAARAEGLTVFLCVGERNRDHEGVYLKTLQEQILESLEGVSRARFKGGVYLTYEPVWAIGKRADDALSAEGIHKMVLFIRKVLAKKYGIAAARTAPVLYGGSVEDDNVAEIVTNGEVVGVLLGHASLNVEMFTELVKKVSEL